MGNNNGLLCQGTSNSNHGDHIIHGRLGFVVFGIDQSLQKKKPDGTSHLAEMR